MKLPAGKLLYYHVQKPTRFKAFDIIVDSNKETKGFVVNEINWVGVMFWGMYNVNGHDFEYAAFNLEKGCVIEKQAYFYCPKTKELLFIKGGTFEPAHLVKVKKMFSDKAHKVLVDFLALPLGKQPMCFKG